MSSHGPLFSFRMLNMYSVAFLGTQSVSLNSEIVGITFGNVFASFPTVIPSGEINCSEILCLGTVCGVLLLTLWQGNCKS